MTNQRDWKGIFQKDHFEVRRKINNGPVNPNDMGELTEVQKRIRDLAEEKDVVILAHNYQAVSYTHLTLPTTPYV
jgi:quinolinate synthase